MESRQNGELMANRLSERRKWNVTHFTVYKAVLHEFPVLLSHLTCVYCPILQKGEVKQRNQETFQELPDINNEYKAKSSCLFTSTVIPTPRAVTYPVLPWQNSVVVSFGTNSLKPSAPYLFPGVNLSDLFAWLSLEDRPSGLTCFALCRVLHSIRWNVAI